VTRTALVCVAAGVAAAIGVAVATLWGPQLLQRPAARAGAMHPTREAEDPSSPETADSAAPRPGSSSGAVAPPLAAADRFDEASLMASLRSIKDSDLSRAVELAREGNRRFPDSPDAPERASVLIHSLSGLGRASEARGEAEMMVNDFDDSAWVREIEQFTGAHRHRNVGIAADGAIEFH
jgi:hypothetical protein